MSDSLLLIAIRTMFILSKISLGDMGFVSGFPDDPKWPLKCSKCTKIIVDLGGKEAHDEEADHVFTVSIPEDN